MAKTGNPFFNGTFGDVDLAAMFDPSKYDFSKFDFSKLNGAFNMPAVDSAEFVKIQQKNIEVLTAANRIAFEGARALMERQVEIARETMARAAEAVNEISSSETIEGRMAKQAAVAKTAFEKSVTDMRELGELSAKSGREAADLLNSRVVESFDEVVAQFNKAA
ncbi:MAG TPA: phasin family protein [Kiloniellaceae bacterium]|nr:phasin family protein [Kiloniellaceae bacterium]